MKIYIKPVAEPVKMECADILAASLEGPKIKVSSESADNTVEALANKQNGSWGNLWNK